MEVRRGRVPGQTFKSTLYNMPRRTNVEKAEVELLTAKLEASTARLEVQQLRNEVRQLQAVLSQYQQEVKEARKLLLKQRLPRRPFCNSTERQLIAASQGWKCAGYDECPLRLLNGGVFDSSLYIIEHVEPWSRSARHVNNRVAYCAWCASKKTRAEIAHRQHQPPSSSESEADDADD